jgi:nucleoside-diphosphate-sugar epimerase
MVDSSSQAFPEATAPLKAINPPDQVLVIGATGQIGRVFLEQGLQLFPNTEFRVLLRDLRKSKDMPDLVECHQGDVRDTQSIRDACEGFTEKSLIFDSVTQIDLSPTDADGTISAINFGGVVNVVEVAKELGLTLHMGHSSAGVPCPKQGLITESPAETDIDEEPIYTTLPYLKAKRQASRVLHRAHEDGLRVMVSYLPTPIGPWSRDDAIFNDLVRTFVKTRRYFHPAGIDMAYVDARDAAKAHWLAFMNRFYGDVILSRNASREDIMGSLEQVFGVRVKPWPLEERTILRLGKLMDFLSRRVLRGKELPLSEVTATLMFANQNYSSEKAHNVLGFAPRPARQSYNDHCQDLFNRRLVSANGTPRSVSIW